MKDTWFTMRPVGDVFIVESHVRKFSAFEKCETTYKNYVGTFANRLEAAEAIDAVKKRLGIG